MNINRTEGVKRGVAMLPNLLTTANLFCGFYSIIQTLKGNYVNAVWLVVLAGLFDFLDGRVARMTNTQSDFGIEYDSLSDLTTFGMAPSLLAYKWSLSTFGKFGVAACFLYFACGALRLARFNVQAGSVEKSDFQGLPTPAAAGTMVSYVLFHRFFLGNPEAPNPFLLALIVMISLLMVSNIRYKSAKNAKRRTSFFTLVIVVTLFFIIASKPEVTLFLFGIGYILSGIIGHAFEIARKVKDLKGALNSNDFSETENATPPTRQQRHNRRRFRKRGQGGSRQNFDSENQRHEEKKADAENVYKMIRKD